MKRCWGFWTTFTSGGKVGWMRSRQAIVAQQLAGYTGQGGASDNDGHDGARKKGLMYAAYSEENVMKQQFKRWRPW